MSCLRGTRLLLVLAAPAMSRELSLLEVGEIALARSAAETGRAGSPGAGPRMRPHGTRPSPSDSEARDDVAGRTLAGAPRSLEKLAAFREA
jgi:hypothetical protein